MYIHIVYFQLLATDLNPVPSDHLGVNLRMKIPRAGTLSEVRLEWRLEISDDALQRLVEAWVVPALLHAFKVQRNQHESLNQRCVNGSSNAESVRAA
jgi:hypothetical protein